MFKNVGVVFLNTLDTFKKNFKFLILVSLISGFIQYGSSILDMYRAKVPMYSVLSFPLTLISAYTSIISTIIMILYVFRSEEQFPFSELFKSANRRFGSFFLVNFAVAMMISIPVAVGAMTYFTMLSAGYNIVGILLLIVLLLLTLYIVVTYSMSTIIIIIDAYQRPIWYSRMLVSKDFMTVFVLSFIDLIYFGAVFWFAFSNKGSFPYPVATGWSVVYTQVIALFYVPFSICAKAEIYKHLMNIEEVNTYDKKNI